MWDGVDRRQFARAEYPCLITIRKNTHPPEAVLTHTQDIGVGGVRVIISKELERMVEVDLEIDLMDTLSNVMCRGIVVRCSEIPTTKHDMPVRYDTGVHFLGLKNDDMHRIDKIVKNIIEKAH